MTAIVSEHKHVSMSESAVIRAAHFIISASTSLCSHAQQSHKGRQINSNMSCCSIHKETLQKGVILQTLDRIKGCWNNPNHSWSISQTKQGLLSTTESCPWLFNYYLFPYKTVQVILWKFLYLLIWHTAENQSIAVLVSCSLGCDAFLVVGNLSD